MSVTGHSADVTVSVTEYSPKSISAYDRTLREKKHRLRQRHNNNVCERTQHLHNENVCVKVQFDVANLLSVHVLPLSLQ